MDVISWAALLFVLALVQTVRASLFLPAFFVLCYMLPFFPLLASSADMDAMFWTGERFVYSPESLQVMALSQVWLVSSLGVICGLLISRVRIRFIDNSMSLVRYSPLKVWGQDRRFNGAYAVIFVLALSLVVLRSLIGGDEIEGAVAGGELITSLLLLLGWTFALVRRKLTYVVGSVFLTSTYAWSQIRTGDRDFFIVIIAVMLILSVLNNWRRAALLGVGLAGAAMVLGGTLISMVRMDVEVSIESLLVYIAFNSWNATILPVLLMIEKEWGTDFFLYGKSYIDLILSFAPSLFYTLFGWEKPVSTDNPAMWFYIEGMGGMHASGVALRNFGLPGVFAQAFLWVLLLARVELLCRTARGFWSIFLYLCLAGALMHAVWYSLISMVNAFVFFAGAYLISSLARGASPANCARVSSDDACPSRDAKPVVAH
jgi:hypothetical protein